MLAASRDTLVVILAGGQGERLSLLSAERAKPAVPYGGKYRIIDFALSNSVHSGLSDVFLLTQYRPVSLHDHVGIGKPWDMDRLHGGVRIVSPFLGRRGADWYRGTADAVFQNLNEIAEMPYEHVLVLGGDHIYKMDYRPMIAQHVERGADVTIGMMEVPLEDASRFGIVESDAAGKIVGWQEKPKKPNGTLASMGIYVFEKEVLIDRLLQDAKRTDSKHDFGGDVVPKMIESGDKVFGYRYDGYWRDVGTLQSFWEANMELIAESPELDLYDRSWPILTKSEERPPAFIAPHAHVADSLVSHGCRIHGQVVRSVLSPGVVVEPGAVVRDSIVMFDSVIGANAVLDRAVLDKEVHVGEGALIGFGNDMRPNADEPNRLNTGLTLIGKRAYLPPGARLGRNVKVAAGAGPEDFPSIDVPSGASISTPPSERPGPKRRKRPRGKSK